jgi:hypothetical protein
VPAARKECAQVIGNRLLAQQFIATVLNVGLSVISNDCTMPEAGWFSILFVNALTKYKALFKQSRQTLQYYTSHPLFLTTYYL